MNRLRLGLLCCLLIALLSSLSLGAEEPWPDSMEQAGAVSPNGKYGILIAGYSDSPDYLADLLGHKLLGPIKDLDAFVDENHSSFHVSWAADSSCCLAERLSRGRTWKMALVETTSTPPFSEEIGERVRRELGRVLPKNLQGDAMGDLEVYVQFGAEGKARLRAFANPDGDHGKVRALFQGTYLVPARKWTATDVRRVTEAQREDLAIAYDDEVIPEGTHFDTPQEKIAWLEKRLAQVYRGLLSILPAKRGEQVRNEQAAWQKQRRANAGDDAAKVLLDRIAALRKQCWGG